MRTRQVNIKTALVILASTAFMAAAYAIYSEDGLRMANRTEERVALSPTLQRLSADAQAKWNHAD